MFGCRTIPKNTTAVQDFKVDKYIGTWYEIARMDFYFERNLINVTAQYKSKTNNKIEVINRGFDSVKKEWKEAIGKAKFVGKSDEAKLKVSFFGPFYSGYNVIAIDEEYKYVLVVGKNTEYLWLLSREKTMPQDVINDYLKKASEIGCDTSLLIWTLQE